MIGALGRVFSDFETYRGEARWVAALVCRSLRSCYTFVTGPFIVHIMQGKRR